MEAMPLSTLAMNKLKGNIKINIIDAPTFGVNRKEIFDDLALLTGATVINEDLGDDLDLIQPELLGTCVKSITSQEETILHISETPERVLEIIDDIKKSLLENPTATKVIKLEKRLARLTGRIALVKVGANSEIELKEKADRIEDAICATKAAIKEGIVPGGGIALLNASHNIDTFSLGEEILLDSIRAPFRTILDNAGMDNVPLETISKVGYGLNVVTGKTVNMIEAGIIDPLLVTKSALRNAASVATTILSTDCVINNLRA
jgi:chaperonin GroEL